MQGKELIEFLQRKYNFSSYEAVAAHLGMTHVSLLNWKNRKIPLTARQIANAIAGASKVAIKNSHGNLIHPIVEFFPINSVKSRQGANFELFPTGKQDNILYSGLRNELERSRGIYIFYDTRGRAIYAGKAKRQSLWSEMKSAFNRERDTQTVYRVKHPEHRQEFVPAYDRSRQPSLTQQRLSDLAACFSAFKIDPEMIDDIEALVVRAFANDLLNVRMERFARERKAAKNGAGRRDKSKK